MIRPADASQNLDERYWHDGVNQLIHMQRSNLDFTADPANPTIDNENLAQQWDLDATGNWSSATTDGDEQRELCRGRRPKTTRIHCGEKRIFWARVSAQPVL